MSGAEPGEGQREGETVAQSLTDLWRRYRQQADRPDWFTRWMLQRTHQVLQLQQPAGLTDLASQLLSALAQPPLTPPVAVDTRVDLLHLRLAPEHALAIADCFAAEADLSAVPLDPAQAKRKNPWGGFREAWLEHYNHALGNSTGGGGMADTQVQSEVAGSVWKVHVQEGDTVKREQELMILESMKMEIPVEAPCDGTVASLLVAPEDGVEEDQVLLIIAS